MNETPEQSSGPEPDLQQIKTWLEAALLAAGEPLSLNQLNGMFDPDEAPGHGVLREALALLDSELEPRAFELVEVASGYRLQIRAPLMPMVSRLWAEKPPRYSRALLETLAIIAYRQPITRGEIEQIRGVSLSGTILKTLQEREWIKVVGHRDIPGKPELLGTTRAFLDYFGLKGLDDLPTLAEIRDLDNIEPELDFNSADAAAKATSDEQTESAEADRDQASDAPQQDGEPDANVEDDGDVAAGPQDVEEEGSEAQSLDDGPENRPDIVGDADDDVADQPAVEEDDAPDQGPAGSAEEDPDERV